ncbi:MAG TPA: hypothetical protein VGH33_26810 [Isosphaeraceae bacterium]
MPRPSNRLPSYRLHRPSGRAVVTLGGKDHYLGRYGSAESRDEYDRLIGEFLASGRGRPKAEDSPIEAAPTTAEAILAFFRHAETHYRVADGRESREVDNLKDALRPVRLYGKIPARSFGLLALCTVRDGMVHAGPARSTVNARVSRIRRVFRWAASLETVPGSVVESLRTLDGLRAGRTAARETDPIRPVPVETVEATLPHMPAPVAAMVRLQLLTGMRAGAVRVMRGADLTMCGEVWKYRPHEHKNQWRGHERVIPLGPKAQEVVRAFLVNGGPIGRRTPPCYPSPPTRPSPSELLSPDTPISRC